MRIVIDARPIVEPKRRGVGRVALRIIEALLEAYPTEEIVCWTSGWTKPVLPESVRKFSNIQHHHTRIPNKLWSLGTLLGICSVDRVVQGDVYLFLNIGFYGNVRAPSILLVHDVSFVIEPAWFTWKQRIWHILVRPQRRIQQASSLLAVSHRTAEDVHQQFQIDRQRIQVISLGRTIDIAVPDVPRDGSILIFGDGDARKNTATAKRAIELCRTTMNQPRIHPVLVDDRTAPDDLALANLYARASAVMYPSWYEGFGLPLHEATQFGTPCVASPTGALPETAPTGTFFANPLKPHHVAEALRLALTTPVSPAQPPSDAWRRTASLIYAECERLLSSRR